MAAPGSSTPGKKDRREEARERARIEREAEKKRQRRNKIFLQGGIGAAVIAIVVVIVLIVVGNTGASSGNTNKAPKNLADGGILFTGSDGSLTATKTPAPKASSVDVTPKSADPAEGVANIVTYIDWACPVCQKFETAYGSQIADLVKSGKATLDVHPISIVDRSYVNSRYASRAANAAMCVANFEPNKFLDAQTEFYDKQPQEGTTGLTNSQIKGLLKDAGVGTDAINNCVDKESYKNWVTTISQKTSTAESLRAADGSFGTPTIFVNGKRWPNSGDFLEFVTANS